MSQNLLEKKVKSLQKISPAFLNMFFYISPAKSDALQILMKFFQQEHIHLKRIPNRKNLNSFGYLLQNANFFAQSGDSLTPIEFERLASFLFSQVTVIALCYQNQMWNISRLDKIKKTSLIAMDSTENFFTLTKHRKFFKNELQNIFF